MLNNNYIVNKANNINKLRKWEAMKTIREKSILDFD